MKLLHLEQEQIENRGGDIEISAVNRSDFLKELHNTVCENDFDRSNRQT